MTGIPDWPASAPAPVQVRPAIGGGGRRARKVLIWQAAIAIALVLVLGIAKQVVAAREVGPDPLSTLGGGTVTPGLDIGGVPQDYQLQALAASYHVDGVVSLSGPSVAEQVTAASLRLGYLVLTVPPGAAPTWTQLWTLAGFMRTHARDGDDVYVHDDIGGGRAVATACMLLLLRGSSWASVQQHVTAPALGSLSQRQAQAIRQLISALQLRGRPGQPGQRNPYSNARIDPW